MALRLTLLVSMALLLLGAAPGETRPVLIEVRTADGASVGRLTGDREERATYVALTDVARLAGGSVRRSRDGDHATLTARGKVLAIRRDSARALVAGRPLELSAPVRVRRGAWLVPADLLVRALPAVLGSGVQVAVGPGTREPAPAAPAVTTVSLPPRPAPPAPRAAPAVEPPAPPPPSSPAARASDGGPPAPRRPEAVSSGTAPAGREGEGAEPTAKGALKAGAIELRYRSYPTYTRVVLEGAAPFEPRLVESGGALVVPLAGLPTPAPRASRAVRDGLVATLELGPARGSPALRVTFERPPTARKVYRLQDPPRLVLDFHRAVAPAPAPSMPDRASGIRTIVVDAGHGGHDPGATGPGGLQEKELTLDVARRLATILQDELGVKVVLTRTRDVFVPLRERTAIANRMKADLFVSIHVNAAPRAMATGTETYFLSTEATDNAARAAAAFENKVIDLEPGARGGGRDLVRSILWDLAQSEFQQESSRLAEALQENLEKAIRQPSRGVKQAPFYVLGGAAMPAVLVEMGFITNGQDEERLKDEGYRDRIARALAAGVGAYKRRYDQKSGVLATR
jgi:N-acetylmuramoyl-L-alanine amidase